MELFHSFSVEVKSYETRPNTLITISLPKVSPSPECLVIFNFNTMRMGPLRDIQSNSISTSLHRLTFISFAAEESVTSLPFSDFINVYKLSDSQSQEESRIKRVIYVEVSTDTAQKSSVTLFLDPDQVASDPYFEIYLRKMPDLENLATIHRPTGESHNFALFRINISSNIDSVEERTFAEKQLWSLLTYLSTAYVLPLKS